MNDISIEDKIKSLKGPIFIFGASGFIGSNLLILLLTIRKDCYAITHNNRYAWRLKLLNILQENILFCDITFKNSVRDLFSVYNPQTIFNLASYGAYSKENQTNLIYETNLIGTVNILEECKNISAYIHAGTSSEYGFNCENPSEADKLIPNSHYSVSKISTSYLIKYYADIYNLNCINLRLFSIYGPWEEPDRLIPQLIEKSKNGSLPPLVLPNISRDFVYIDDSNSAFINAAYYMNNKIKGESINIATGQKTTIKELAYLAIKLFNLNIEPKWGGMPNRKWDLENWYGNYNKAKEIINWEPQTLLKDGILKISEWQDKINYKNIVLPAFFEPKRCSKITSVIACYNDAPAIPVMYERLVKMFTSLNVNYEIIFVNDSSPDDTENILQNICLKDQNVISITHSRNFGSQSAFLSGMEISTGDAVVLMDGDLQDPPEIIPQFYEKWLEGFEVVYGQRVKREATFLMNIFYKIFYRLFRKLSYINIPVDAGDFSMIDRKVVKELVSLPEKEQFLRGLRAWVGFKQTGINYIRPERMFGISTNNWRKNIWWAKKAIFSFSFVPLEILSYFGLILTLFSFIAIILQIIARFLYPDTPQGLSTIIVLILFFGGIQLLAVSILGEYLIKIFEETKGRPKFIRKSIIYRGERKDTSSEIANFVKTFK